MIKHKVAVLTGAASGMTCECARLLAKKMTVAIWDRDGDAAEEAAAQIRAIGGEAAAWRVDVSDRSSEFTAATAVNERFGRIDVLVTGAGFVQYVDFLLMTEEQWDRMIDVHLKGTFLCTQAVLPSMQDHGYGRIVCISSVGGMNGAARHSHYGAAKAGVIGFCKALCKEIGPYGITINAIAPGAIETHFGLMRQVKRSPVWPILLSAILANRPTSRMLWASSRPRRLDS